MGKLLLTNFSSFITLIILKMTVVAVSSTGIFFCFLCEQNIDFNFIYVHIIIIARANIFFHLLYGGQAPIANKDGFFIDWIKSWWLRLTGNHGTNVYLFFSHFYQWIGAFMPRSCIFYAEHIFFLCLSIFLTIDFTKKKEQNNSNSNGNHATLKTISNATWKANQICIRCGLMTLYRCDKSHTEREFVFVIVNVLVCSCFSNISFWDRISIWLVWLADATFSKCTLCFL